MSAGKTPDSLGALRETVQAAKVGLRIVKEGRKPAVTTQEVEVERATKAAHSAFLEALESVQQTIEAAAEAFCERRRTVAHGTRRLNANRTR